MKRRAVSIVELSIGIALMMILASQITLSTNISTQTPKREAEKLAKKLSSLMLKADKMHVPFTLTLETDKMIIQWNTSTTSLFHNRNIERFPASSGCTYSWNGEKKQITYTPENTTFTQSDTIKIEGNGEPYYVIPALFGSRVRVSDVPPP